MSSDGESNSGYETPRKRQRLSSPTYDEQFEMSQQEVDAFDVFDRLLSQKRDPSPKISQPLSHQIKRKRSDAEALSLKRDGLVAEDHTGAKATADLQSTSAFTKASDLTASGTALGFAPASHLPSQENPFLVSSSSSPHGPIGDEAASWFSSTDIPAGGLMFKSAEDLAMAPPDDDIIHHDDGDDWLTAPPPPGAVMGFQSAKKLSAQPADADGFPSSQIAQVAVGFTSASALRDDRPHPDSSDNAPRDRKEAVPAFVGFQTGSSLLGASSGAKKSPWSAPSAEALAKAAERMRRWQAEIDAEIAKPAAPEHEESADTAKPSTQPSNPERVVLGDVENSVDPSSSQPLSQPLSQSMSQPGIPDTPTPIRSEFKLARSSIGSPMISRKAFKSPLINKSATPSTTTTYAASPLNPNRTAASGFTKSSAFKTPMKAALPSTEAGPSTSVSTPTTKVLGSTPRRPGNSPVKKSAFVTPFKSGMRPGEPGRTQLETTQKTVLPAVGPAAVREIAVTPIKKDKGKGRAVYFDLTPPSDRKTLATSGLRPQSYTQEELEAFGTSIADLSGMTPCSAYYYRFYGRPSSSKLSMPPAQDPSVEYGIAKMVLGPEEMLSELKARGCRLATDEWVNNNYGLILWKLAGMVALEPQRELDEATRRWCWDELLRQFLYRYERELNSGVRPPIRLIASQDKPAGLPMVLCISRICSPYEYDVAEGGYVDPGPFTVDENGEQVPPRPVVEVTDGWYRVRAEVDDAMVRAIRRGALRVGMKVGVVATKLINPRSEPFEILEHPWRDLKSDSSFALRISGNGCHLAPWHAKLGFQAQPFVATLPSLCPDGGLIPVMDVRIVKAFPIAYMECFTTPEGKKWSHPMKEPEEIKARDAWIAKQDMEAQRIRADMDKYFDTLEKCADRLEIRGGMHFRPGEYDSPPDTVDDLLDALEEACANSGHHETPKDIITRTSHEEAGWLARAVRDKLVKDRENMSDEIAQRLHDVCPPRAVRSFRVVVIEDAQTRKRPKQFTAQITIWEVLTAYVSEDGIPGDFRVGDRFIVTNLDPNNTDAWMPRQDGAVVYLIARRDTRWRKIK